MTTNQFEKITDIKARRKAFIEDEVAFYNSDNRAEMNGSCFYRAIGDSPGCAIGRYLDRNSDVIKFNVMGSIDSIIEERGNECIPKWMFEMGGSFLSECQSLHDISMYWDEKGLTESGQERMKLIIEEFC